MNITDLHTQQKEISAVPFFKGELTMSMQLEKNGTLKEHSLKRLPCFCAYRAM